MGEHDMDSFYDSLTKSTVVKDKKIEAKIKKLHTKASTLSAMHDINHFFDTLAQKKEQETKKNLEKENGKGKQALEEVNSYFDSLDAQEKAQNEKDILNLGTGASVAEAAKRRVAALKASHAAANKGPKGAAAQAAHKRAAAAAVKLGEDDAAAKKEIADYFASLDAQEATQNRADEDRLSQHGKYRRAKAAERLDSASSDKDLGHYFDKLSQRVHMLDKVDKARLRKDTDPVNANIGARVAYKAAAVSRLRARKAKPRTFH